MDNSSVVQSNASMDNSSSVQSNDSSNPLRTYTPPLYEVVIQCVILFAVLLVAIAGNGFVCFCVFTTKHLQVPTNYFIVSLASADFFFAILALPFRLYDVLSGYVWHLGLHTCRYWVWLDLLFCSASIANLAAVSVDRYLKISSPLTYNARMTPRKVCMALIMLWGYSMILATLTLVEWSPDPADNARGTILEHGICRMDDKIFLTVISVLGFFAPFAIMLLMYYFVFKVAVEHAARVARQQESFRFRDQAVRPRKKRGRRKSSSSIALLEVKATKTLILLLSVFCICWCPYFVISLISLHRIEWFYPLPLWLNKLIRMVFVTFLPNCNSALNPIIYSTNNHQFRTVIRKMLRRQRERARNLATAISEGSHFLSEARRPSGSSTLKLKGISINSTTSNTKNKIQRTKN